MQIRLVRKGQFKAKEHFNITQKPGKTLFDFMLNVNSAAFHAANELSYPVYVTHDELFSMKPYFGLSVIPFDRRKLRIK